VYTSLQRSNVIVCLRLPSLQSLSAQQDRRVGCCSSAIQLDARYGAGLPEESLPHDLLLWRVDE
jgi:hypothetical protein